VHTITKVRGRGDYWFYVWGQYWGFVLGVPHTGKHIGVRVHVEWGIDLKEEDFTFG
jgi:hypothetical protein